MSAKPLAFVNARLVDPETGAETRGGLLVEDGRILDFGPHVTPAALAAHFGVIDCGGHVLAPGLIDLRAYVGEPGGEHRESIATATAAAAVGGVTTIVASPETCPPIDDPAVVDFLKRRARDHGRVRVLPAAAISKNLDGQEISEFGLLREAGAVAFTDGSRSIRNSQTLRRALTYARDFDALIVHFPEDRDLAGAGVMNAGELATRLGLSGAPREAEAITLDRDIRLVRMTGARYCAAPISTTLALETIAKAKAEGLPVSCGVTINHLTLNENDIGDYRTFLKVKPPLRREEERLALVEAVASGLIDIIFSDHNPQDVETKRLPFAEADFGAVGLETLLPAALRLVHGGALSLAQVLRAMSFRPAEILRLPQGRLKKGAPADLIVFDPDEPFVLNKDRLKSRSKNTPFDEARLQGVVKTTMVAGAVVHGLDARVLA
ncbi:dihydroorotase [Rhodoblastus sphagnicola]|uniref:Dihydroorotase n=1 Tax=Rhodoblastus sphagnicola TaxID=333368 RepID=A0A2S6MVN8_9HYPH|nr:dihydroorotase [Rhodoblastus sphagnicola]MBB4198357.1 dihydroorotase [Rhodoblastus sphagnicola]PPQ26427.1 dihydroorotase [Rhodoblastus sphagnicola]